ncbi:hypothetical protein [Solibacillus sp. FSL K6-1523]|uniref:hypothetical protein n=1 Tax=Solibacillus sp. FSL K6-1523 TaxID=2921471 RepID=UPI0030FBB43F
MFNKVSMGVIIAAIIAFMIAMYAALIQVFGIDNANKATIIGGLLSMIGGGLGALGAYLVARNQIEKERKIGRVNMLSKELPIYINLILEFEKIIAQLRVIEEKKDSLGYRMAFERNGGFRSLIIIFDALEWNRWNEINGLSDSILLKELLKFQESFKRMSDVFEYDVALEGSPLFSLYNENRNKYKLLIAEVENMVKEKEDYYKELPYILEKANKIYSVLQSKSTQIENILEGKIDVDEFVLFTPTKLYGIDGKVK